MQPDMLPVLQVAAKTAIINKSGKVLILREAATGKDNTKVGQWGLVGGRLNPGETFEDGLKREVSEETGLTVEVLNPIYIGEWHPVIRDVPYQIIAVFILCRATAEEVQLSAEHDAYEWIDPARRIEFSMMEPDCFVVDKLAGL